MTDGKYNTNMTINVRFVSDDAVDNLHSPVFNQTIYYLSLPSTKTNKTNAIFQFKATDSDNNLLVYDLSETGYHFQIDPFTGELYMVKTLDNLTYSINITVYDSVISTSGTRSASIFVVFYTPITGNNTTHSNAVAMITAQSSQTVLIATLVSCLVALIIIAGVVFGVLYYRSEKFTTVHKYNNKIKGIMKLFICIK